MCLASSCFAGSRAILIAPVLSDERGVGAVVVTPKNPQVILLKDKRYKSVLTALKRSIRASLDLVDPLAGNKSDMRGQRNRISGASALQSSNLLSHSMLPLRVSNIISVGCGLHNGSSSKVMPGRRAKSGTITKGVVGSRLRRRPWEG